MTTIDLPTADLTFEEDGGRVSVSKIVNRNGIECWIHDLECPDCKGTLAARLMARARRQASEWGFTEVWANVTNPRLAQVLRDHGWSLEQLIFKGRTHHG